MHRSAPALGLVLLAGCPSSDSPAEENGSGSSTSGTSSAASSGSGEDGVSGPVTTATPDTSDGDPDSTGMPDPTDVGDSSTSGDPIPPNLTPGCGKPATGDVLDGVINVDGEDRTYIIEVPEEYDPNTPYPIIFGFHGDGGDSSNARNGYDLTVLYGGEAIVIYPDGSGAGASPAWNTANGGPDLNMVIALAQEIGTEMCFDLNRVHAFGYSRGAAMAHAAGCYRGDLFTGIGASSGWAPSTGLCQRPIAIFMSHGLTDDRVPFSTGRSVRDAWAAYNGCEESTVELEQPGCIEYEGCDAGAPVQFCEFDGGHTFDPDYAESAVTLFRSL